MSRLLATLNSEKSQLSYDLKTGVAYGSKRLAARLAGVSVGSVIEMLKGDQLQPSKGAEFLLGRGFKGDQLLGDKASLPADLIQSIITYFAMYAGRWCNNVAKANLDFLSQVGLTVAMKSALDIPVGDRPQQSAPQVVVEQPDVTINIGSAQRSHHDHLTPLHSHLDEVSKLRKRIKKFYNTAEEQEEKAAYLAILKEKTLKFCRDLSEQPAHKPGDLEEIKIPDVFAEMDSWAADKNISNRRAIIRQRHVALVKYRYKNQEASPSVIGAHFGVSGQMVTGACNKLGYWDLPGVELSNFKLAAQ